MLRNGDEKEAALSLRKKTDALEQALDEAKAVQAASFDLGGVSTEQVIAHSLHVAYSTFVPAGHESGRFMRPFFCAPLPSEDELIHSSLSARAQREAREAAAKNYAQRETESIRERAAEAAHDMFRKLTPEALSRLQQWRPGQPPPDGFELQTNSSSDGVQMPVPKAESLKPEFQKQQERSGAPEAAADADSNAINAEATGGSKPQPQVSLDIGGQDDDDEEVVEEVESDSDEEEEEEEEDSD